MKILIVEDEPAIQELLALNLTQAGHNPIRALTVEQAQLLMREALPDLILLDWMLPGMSGIEFARKLKAEELTKNIDEYFKGNKYKKVLPPIKNLCDTGYQVQKYLANDGIYGYHHDSHFKTTISDSLNGDSNIQTRLLTFIWY